MEGNLSFLFLWKIKIKKHVLGTYVTLKTYLLSGPSQKRLSISVLDSDCQGISTTYKLYDLEQITQPLPVLDSLWIVSML